MDNHYWTEVIAPLCHMNPEPFGFEALGSFDLDEIEEMRTTVNTA